MSDIPTEVFREILLRLPADSLFRFRAVCKEWRRLIDDASFIKSHTNNNNQLSSNTLLIRNRTGAPLYLISLDSLDFTDDERQSIDAIPIKQLIRRGVPRLGDLPAASCNGLILISSDDIKKTWAIWNPLTRACHELPQLDTKDVLLTSSGLSYDDADDDYKVVRIHYLLVGGDFVHKTYIYSMKVCHWRMTKDCPYDLRWGGNGVFLNGALHWASRVGIIAFDLATEDYLNLPLPPVNSRPKLFDTYLDVLGGSLILSYYYGHILDGWVMNDYGVGKSWKKLLSLGKYDLPGYLSRVRPVAYLKGKRQVILQQDMGFYWFNVEDGSVKKVSIHGLSGISSAQICTGSLVRLGDGGCVAPKKTTGVKRKRMVIKKRVEIRLTFCVRDVDDWYCSDLSCCSVNSNCSSEGED